MKIIKVIPISKGISKETLSYFTALDVDPGSIVSVPMRKKTINALVVEKENVNDLKSEIKSAPFEIRKVDKITAIDLLTPEFIEAAKKTASYYCATTGSVLNTLIPHVLLENAKSLNIKKEEFVKGPIREKFIIQGDDEERFTNYRSLIREEFAKKSSVFFCVPTIEDVKKSIKWLEKGIEDYTFIIHGGLSKKVFVENWKKIHEEKHPVLIIGTGSYLTIPRRDIKTIVIEKENSRAYKLPSRPHIDTRFFAETLAKEINAKLLMGDIILRIETLYRHKNGELIEFAPLKFRSLSTSTQTMVDMKAPKNGEKQKFRILSEELEKLILTSHQDSEHLFILCTRRGLAPSTICGDCQNTVMCTHCSSPIVLHTSKNGEKNFFLCHRCGERRSSEEYCKTCGSWKLGPVGIGIDLIESKLKDKFPNIKVFKIDSDTTKTEKAILTVMTEFYASPGSILLGTEMALLYLSEKVHNAAIVSVDSLFSLPDFRIRERICYMLLKTRYLTTKRFILQTRNAEENVLEHALKGNLFDFYREEIEGRKKFAYPPFSVLIKITLEGEKSEIVKEMESLQTSLEPYTIDVFPAFTQTVRGKNVLHGLIKLESKKWVDKELLEKLLSLPPYITVKVDPESLL